MRRMLFCQVALLIASCAPAFAAVADFAEEMEAAPGFTNWLNGDGVDSNGDTWIIENTLLEYNLPNPAVGETSYTYEFRVRLLNAPITGSNPGRAWPVSIYMSDANSSMGRSGFYYGIEDSEFSYVMDKPYSKFPVTETNGKEALKLPVGDPNGNDGWTTIRVIQNEGANRTQAYVNGSPLYFDNPGAMPPFPTTNTLPWFTDAGGLNGPDNRLELGSNESPDGVRVEWDYFRIVNGVVPIGELITVAGATCGGDLNGDGTTDGADVAIIYNAWGPAAPGSPADINVPGGDGNVDGADLAAVFNCWGQADVGPSSVPEPASFGILGLGLVGLLAARRR